MEKVSVVYCSNYEQERVNEATRRCVDLAGGMQAFVRPGQRVVLKVNLLSANPPEKAVTTHPAVVRALAEMVREVGGVPVVADSPGPLPYNTWGLKKLYRETGLEELAAGGLVELNWDTSAAGLSCPEGKVVKRFDVISPVAGADVVIAVPKLKTHMLTTLTGATKILFGVVPGYTKAGYHSKFKTGEQFAGMLLDLVTAVKPDLYVMDGILAMEGDGPGLHGSPRPLGVMMSSRDAVAMDVAACLATGIDPLAVPMLQEAAERGWWNGDTAGLELDGDPLDGPLVGDFQKPSRVVRDSRGLDSMPWYKRVWAPLVKRALSLRPVPDKNKCTGCATCARVCPQQAVTLSGKQAVIDDRQCIRCYCCHEMCPEAAVRLQYGTLGRAARLLGLTGR